MYHMVNQCAAALVEKIPPEHITEYEWLLQNLACANTLNYQSRYRKYWAMDAARLNPAFYDIYFKALVTQSSREDVLRRLHNATDQKSLQFSFATKLLHMVNPRLPLYSAEVTTFFFFLPKGNLSFERRVDELIAFHDFLIGEYQRVIETGLLSCAIQEFRRRWNPQCFTDEKIIDSLIWAFVKRLKNGAVWKSDIVYR